MDNPFLTRLLWDETGPTSVEYAVMLALIIAVSIGAIELLGGSSQAYWQNNVDRVEASG